MCDHRIDVKENEQQDQEEYAPNTSLVNLPLEMVVQVMSELTFKACLNLRQTNLIIENLFYKFRSSMKGPTINCTIRNISGYVEFRVFNTELNSFTRIAEDRWKFVCQNGHINKCSISTDELLPKTVMENIFCALSIKDISYQGVDIDQFWADVIFSNASGKRKLVVQKWDASVKFNGDFALLKVSEPLTTLNSLIPNVQSLQVFSSTRTCRDAANILRNFPSNSIKIEKWILIFSDLEADEIGQFPNMTELMDQVFRVTSNDLMAAVDFDRVTFQIVE